MRLTLDFKLKYQRVPEGTGSAIDRYAVPPSVTLKRDVTPKMYLILEGLPPEG